MQLNLPEDVEVGVFWVQIRDDATTIIINDFIFAENEQITFLSAACDVFLIDVCLPVYNAGNHGNTPHTVTTPRAHGDEGGAVGALSPDLPRPETSSAPPGGCWLV